MSEDAKHLIRLNAQIRETVSVGAVESMMRLIEERRRFLDAIPSAKAGRSPALIAALHEAASDNAVLVTELEKVMQTARKRGKLTALARRNYNKTQTNP
ncbi:hypothetical protein LSUCC0031_04445 [Rhodobacterales bacterium LSUCC0031]|nr:hypothetical protein [Rhodobacterales bacterium LSUCC0031]